MPLVVYILALATFSVGTQTYVFSGLLSQLAAELDISVAVAGQLITAYALLSAITAPFIVNVVAGVDRKKVILIAMFCMAAINFTTALLPDYPSLLIARIALALCASVVFPLAGAIAAESVPANSQGQALGIVLSGLTLAFILGVPLGSVIGGIFGWRATFVFAGGIILLVLPLLMRFAPSSAAKSHTAWSNFKVIQTPAVHLSLILSGLSFVVGYSVYTYIGPVIESLTGFKGAEIGLLQTIVGLGSVLGITMGIRLADHSHYARSLLILFLALFVSNSTYALWFWLFDAPATMLALPLGLSILMASAVLFALGPVIEKALVQVAPEHSALTLAMNTSMIYFGQALGAVAGGVTIDTFGLSHIGLASAALGLLSVLFLCFSYQRLSTR